MNIRGSANSNLKCRCRACGVDLSLTADQLSNRSGLICCKDCGQEFNAAWNLVDQIPNPAETLTSVAPISATRLAQDGSPDRFTNVGSSQKLDRDDSNFLHSSDELYKDIELKTDHMEALEEIRITFHKVEQEDEIDGRLYQTQKQLHPKHARKNTSARKTREEPRFSEITQPDINFQSSGQRRLVDKTSNDRRTKIFAFWLSAIILTAACLFLQVRYLLFYELSVIPSARSTLELFCRAAGCTVPMPLTGPEFQILRTQVDLDPRLPEAVIVKIDVKNRTKFPRPYPNIHLSLTNGDGQTIGSRVYKHEDYDPSTDRNDIPPESSSVITLHLANPDEQAVGFEPRIIQKEM